MRPWRTLAGAGAACAVCCAVPLFGGMAALTAGSATLAAVGAGLVACADELLLPLAGVLVGAVLVSAVALWRRREGRKVASGAACTLPARTPSCACPTGRCG